MAIRFLDEKQQPAKTGRIRFLDEPAAPARPLADTTAVGGVEKSGGADTARLSPELNTFDPDAARRLAKTLPVAGAIAAPALLPAVPAGLTGIAAMKAALPAVGASMLGAATGEAGRQLVDAATGKPESSPLEAAKKIGIEGALAGGSEVGGRAAIKTAALGFSAIRDSGRVLLDFLGNLRRGTARAAGKLPKEAFAEPLTVEAIRKYGQGVSDAVKYTRRAIGQDINTAIAAADEAAPAGTVPFSDVVLEFHKLNKNLRTQAAIPGASPATQKAVANLQDYLVGWLEKAGPNRRNLTIQETKDLLDRVRDAIPYDATNPGASKAALKRLQPFADFLRKQMPDDVDGALRQYEELIEASDAITKGIGIKGGEKITPERVIELEANLKKLVKEGGVKRTVEQTELAKVGAKKELLERGEALAVQQELSQQAPTVSGEGGLVGLTSRLLRSATSPLTRALFLPASRGLNLLRVPSEQGAAGVSSALVKALLSQRSREE